MSILTEVKWDKFQDVEKFDISAEELAKKLNAELDAKEKEYPHGKFGWPHLISKKRIRDIRGKEGVLDMELFKKQLMKRPSFIFNVGEKSQHSATEDTLTINTGIPALRAVVWDEDENKFIVVTTCKGAGNCIVDCYALQGLYILNSHKNVMLVNRLQMMMNHPDDYEQLAYMEAGKYAAQAKFEDKKLEIRWNDAGDIYSKVYFDMMVSITNKLLKKGYNVESYFYSKQAEFVKLGEEHGIVTQFSADAKKKEIEKLMSYKKDFKLSITVPRNLFKEFFIPKTGKTFEEDPNTGKPRFRDENSKELLRKRVFAYYKHIPPKNEKLLEIQKHLTLDNLIYVDELPKQEGKPLQYNVIVLSHNDSDIPAQRRDVRATLLFFH